MFYAIPQALFLPGLFLSPITVLTFPAPLFSFFLDLQSFQMSKSFFLLLLMQSASNEFCENVKAALLHFQYNTRIPLPD
jgi:hypothetical protein